MQLLVEYRDALAHMIKRGLQDLAIVVNGGIGVIEQLERCFGRNGALAQEEREDEAGRCRADRGRKQMLGIAQELEVRVGFCIKAHAAREGVAVERSAGAFLAQITAHGGDQLLDRDRRAPQPKAGGNRSKRGRNEQVGLETLDRSRRAPDREDHVCQNIERQRPDHAVRERRQVEAEQGLWPQCSDTPWSVGEKGGADDSGIGKVRQQQRIGPYQYSTAHSCKRAARGSPPPDQATEESRCKLRHCRKRQQPDRGELRLAGQPVIDISERDDEEDRRPAHGEQQASDIFPTGDQVRPSLQDERHHDVVRKHDAERHRFHDHHGGCGGKTADKGDYGEQVGLGRERQRQDEHVAIDLTIGKGQQARQCDRNHKQVDQHEIERKQPGRAPDLGLVVVLHHGHVELSGQQDDRKQREKCHGGERTGRGLAGERRGGCRLPQRLPEESKRPIKHPERRRIRRRQRRRRA